MTGGDAPAARDSFAAAALDGQARLVLVAWLCGWFALTAALAGLWVAGAGTPALTAALASAAGGGPLVVLGRLAGLPAAYELEGGRLEVHRYLARRRTYRLTGPARRDHGALRLRRRRVLLGGGYGCRRVTWALRAGADPERLQLATTSLIEIVRVPTSGGPLLVTPDDPEAFLRAAAARMRD